MTRVGILYSRVRAEEKLLFEAFQQRGVDFDLIDDRQLVFDLTDSDKGSDALGPYDVVVERCINHSRALYSLRILNDRGVETVNTAHVADVCGNKLQTTSALNCGWRALTAHAGGLYAGERVGRDRGVGLSGCAEAGGGLVGAIAF